MSHLDNDKTVTPFPVEKKPRPGPDGEAKRAIRVIRQWERMDEPELEDQIEGVFHARTLNLFCAQKGQGKTQVAVGLGMCIATGEPWAGHKVVLRGPVIYIIGEDADGLRARVIASRFDAGIGEHNLDFDVIEDRIDFVKSGADLNSLIVAVDGLGYKQIGAIFLDTYSTVIGGEKEDERTAGAVANAGQMLCKQFRCSVFVVHHQGKDASKGPRGSGVLLDRCSTAITIKQVGNVITLVDEYQRNRRNKLITPKFRTETKSYTSKSGRTVRAPLAVWIDNATDTGPALDAVPEYSLSAKQKVVWKAFENALASKHAFMGSGPNVPKRRMVLKYVWREEAINLDFYPEAEPTSKTQREKWVARRTKNFNDIVAGLVDKGMCHGFGPGQDARYWKIT